MIGLAWVMAVVVSGCIATFAICGYLFEPWFPVLLFSALIITGVIWVAVGKWYESD